MEKGRAGESLDCKRRFMQIGALSFWIAASTVDSPMMHAGVLMLTLNRAR